MTKVILEEARKANELEETINKTLKHLEESCDVVDIKFATRPCLYSALIIYREKGAMERTVEVTPNETVLVDHTQTLKGASTNGKVNKGYTRKRKSY